MPETTRQPKPGINPDTTQTLAYWMGRVDANLGEMKAAIEGFGKKNDTQWDEFEAWRREVDERLHDGSSTFAEHNRRIETLERTSIGKHMADQAESAGRSKFGSWDWFRDSYLEKFVFIVLSLALYKFIELLVLNWANLS